MHRRAILLVASVGLAAALAVNVPAPARAADLSAAAIAADPLAGHEFTAALLWSRVFFRTFPDEVSTPVGDVGSTIYQANDGGHPQPLLQYLSPAWEFLKFKDAQGSAVAGLSLLSAAATFQAESTFSGQGPLHGDYWLITPFLFFRGGPLFESTDAVYFRGGFGYGAATLRAQADYFSQVYERRQQYRRGGFAWNSASIFIWELHWGRWVLSRRTTAIAQVTGRSRFSFDDFSLALQYRWNFGAGARQ